MNPRAVRGVLRWYPVAWRRRYGAELIAMLDDTYGMTSFRGGPGCHC